VRGDLKFALELADLADSISLERFRANDLHVAAKDDGSPVTDADLAIEREIRRTILASRPGETVVGEEYGEAGGSARWIVDPIDGTTNYARGVPVWGTLIALEREGTIVAGVASAPALGRRWWAERGGGAFKDGRAIHVSRVASLAQSSVTAKHAVDLTALRPAVRSIAPFEGFCRHVAVAEGAVELSVDGETFPWDYAAVQVIVEEAGGLATTRTGGRPERRCSFVTSNGLVHSEAIALLPVGSAGSR